MSSIKSNGDDGLDTARSKISNHQHRLHSYASKEKLAQEDVFNMEGLLLCVISETDGDNKQAMNADALLSQSEIQQKIVKRKFENSFERLQNSQKKFAEMIEQKRSNDVSPSDVSQHPNILQRAVASIKATVAPTNRTKSEHAMTTQDIEWIPPEQEKKRPAFGTNSERKKKKAKTTTLDAGSGAAEHLDDEVVFLRISQPDPPKQSVFSGRSTLPPAPLMPPGPDSGDCQPTVAEF